MHSRLTWHQDLWEGSGSWVTICKPHGYLLLSESWHLILLSTKMGPLVWSSEGIPVSMHQVKHAFIPIWPLAWWSTVHPTAASRHSSCSNSSPGFLACSLSLSLSLCPKLHSLYRAQECCYLSTSPGWMRPSGGFLPKHCPDHHCVHTVRRDATSSGSSRSSPSHPVRQKPQLDSHPLSH